MRVSKLNWAIEMDATPSAPEGYACQTQSILHLQRQWAWYCKAAYEMIAGQEHFH